jgi:hypothetical protein
LFLLSCTIPPIPLARPHGGGLFSFAICIPPTGIMLGMHVSGAKIYDITGTYGPYWSLRKTYYVNRQRHIRLVAYVGKAPNRRAAYTLARARGMLCGGYGCFEAPTVEVPRANAKLCAEHARQWHRCEADPSMGSPAITPLAPAPIA